MTAGSGTRAAGPDVAGLAAVARALGRAAGDIRAAGRALTAVVTDPALVLSLLRSPRTGLRAVRALAGALTASAGLGFAPDGGRVGRAAWLGGVLTGRESLAVAVAVTSLELRIRLCSVRHPEFSGDGPVRRLLEAIAADRQARALRVLRHNVREQGAERALAQLAPSLTEVMAWNALVDENPFNDAAAWHIVTGTRADGDPLLGTSIGAWARWDRGCGRAELLPPEPGLLARLDTGGSISGHLRNVAVLGTDGRMLIHRVKGPDGVRRHLVLLPGMAFGRPRNPTPQDLVGAVTAVGRNDSSYTRAVRKALARVVPVGTQVALLGHSLGGITALNLTEIPDVNARWRLTHAVAVGSPIDFKRPRDPETRVVSLVNEHDVVPNLEGRSPVSVFPVPEDWLEITWVDRAHDFPQCHNAGAYAQSLDDVVPEARDRVDALLEPYRGRVEETFVLRLHDR
ncbi:alpha/beta fold hydrolase [Streptomyces sp. NPDC053048]|uniref:alpha/beta fold hydrolase n=1 Tax=Streptomyces sp. NPDC053048 TaxID=3365694 RepID=UPI0037D7A4CA